MHKKSFFQQMTMPLPELEEYYRRCREEAFLGNMPIRGMKVRKLIHPLLLLAVRVRRLLSRQTLHVFDDRHTDTGGPLIYAATHIGYSDVEMIYSAIKFHAYIFWGDPRELYRRIEGFLLGLNGTICCDTSSKSDRHIGKETCVRLLNQGGSLLIYPEGAWNILENQVVMPLYTGAVEMAIRTGAQVVPVAIEEYGKHYYVNIGRNIKFDDYSLDQKQEATDLLRDTLCTLKWEILEKYGKCSRKDISEGYSDIFLSKFNVPMGVDDPIEEINRTRYHHKGVTEPDEAFRFMKYLKPCRENAFLFVRDRDVRMFGLGSKGEV